MKLFIILGNQLFSPGYFNKYKDVNLDRRINLLLYLNHDWNIEWNGNLGLYNKDDLKNPKKIIKPDFNRCVIFTTNSNTYHGHPEKLKCPDGTSRKSIALYYYSYGRPASEMGKIHGTRFRNDSNFFKESSELSCITWTLAAV